MSAYTYNFIIIFDAKPNNNTVKRLCGVLRSHGFQVAESWDWVVPCVMKVDDTECSADK